jgi:trimeric autotransporter adhesin
MATRRILVAALATGCFVLAPAPHVASAITTIEIVGPTGSVDFGRVTLVLSNGNYVVLDPQWNSPTATNAGAVYLYDGATNALISKLTGSTFNDFVGSAGVIEVGTSDFVVASPGWNNSGHAQAGAVTWVDGTTGLNGVVSVDNSLVGTQSNDRVGATQPTALKNGNYAVDSFLWNNGPLVEAGAVTWGNGFTGTKGDVSPANSLVGAMANDHVGENTITPLTNGNYTVSTGNWSDTIEAGGAVTWVSGATGLPHGPVQESNSLIGLFPFDQVGTNPVIPLTNGNYVVGTSNFHNAGLNGTGAATWGDGSGGTTVGVITSSNSFLGGSPNDRVGSGGIVSLANGNYVIDSPSWDNGLKTDAGAITWGNGAVRTGGTVFPSNSIVGDVDNERIGSGGVAALANGSYVMSSPFWSSPTAAHVGAVTRVDGSARQTGAITAASSLIGSTAEDQVGLNGAVALTNGNYVVRSPVWTNGLSPRVGAATWMNGAIPSSGIVSTANSLFGGTIDDMVSSNAVVPLANGNYVVSSPMWRGFIAPAVGAATWGNGSTGTFGQVTAANSLTGSSGGNSVSSGSIAALTNGNYVVRSPAWDSASTANVGAATWGNGATGVIGAVSSANSLVGVSAGDAVGSYVDPLPGGNYLAETFFWDNGPVMDAGAFTFGAIGGVVGSVNSANSLLGSQTVALSSASTKFTTDDAIAVGATNRVILVRVDLRPPTIAQGVDIVAHAPPGAHGVPVFYVAPVATDNRGAVTVTCTPPSGSVFPIGATTVMCTATDGAGFTASTSFVVTVDGGADYVPLAPARLADTRLDGKTTDGLFAGVGIQAAGTTLELTVAGRGGVATNAATAVLNVTATEAAGPGFLTVYPCGSPQPTASSLNYTTGSTVPNAVITKIGASGAVCIFTQLNTHLVVDVNGYFPTGTSLQSINPARVLDTRPGGSTLDGLEQGEGLRPEGSVTTVQISGRVGLPIDPSAAVLNVTVTEPVAPGYVTVFPCGTAPPTASNINVVAGATVADLVVAKIGVGGAVCIFSQSATHLVVDIDGFFPHDAPYTALDPARLLDTRTGSSTIDGQFVGAGILPLGTVTTLQVTGRGGVLAGASSVVLNVTVTEPVAAGFVTVYPCGIDPPLASNLNFAAGATIANAVIVALGPGGTVCLFNSQPTHLVADVNGSIAG